MSNGAGQQQQISPEEIESLQQIVVDASKNAISKVEALSELSSRISSICAKRNIEFTANLIRPYIEQIDSAEREKETAE